jgi:hypothetical protein
LGYHWGEEYISRLKNPAVFVLPGSFVAGLLIYSILSFLYTPIGISIPLSILISTLVFGLNSYYFLPRSITTKENERIRQHNINASSYVYRSLDFFVVWVYGILFSILFLTSVSEQEEFSSYIPWEQITSLDSINLANATAFSFFLPGYGLVVLLDKNRKFSLPIKLLLAYLISILFVALPSYAGASFGYTIANIELFIVALYAVIFVLFLLQQLKSMRADFCYLQSALNRGSLSRVYRILKSIIPEFAVFASLFALVVFYTYYLNDNHIVVDQWFHHGRALLIGSEHYKDIAPAESYKDPYTDTGSDITQIYPPIFSSLLAGFFELSNSASVNAYVSIGFLNIMPVFAFHYFFTRWVPDNMKKASLLATTLFVLSSGFGWIYAVGLAMVSPPDNEMSSINILAHVSDTAYDIGLPTTFINVGHPDITTPLIIIALPAGFTSLGMIKEFVIRKGKEEGPSIINTDSNKNRTFETALSGQRHFTFTLKRATGSTTMRRSIPITLACFLGILSHDEYYLFIIIACTAIVALLGSANLSFRGLTDRLSGKTLVYGYSIFFSSFLVAMFMVALVDTFISPTKYYVTREIAGIPLIFLCFIYASSAWVAYVTIYAASRRRKISLFHSGNSDASSNNDKSKREITGASTKRPDYAISKSKEISGSSKIKKLLSISNSSSSPSGDSRDGSIVSLRVGQAVRLFFPISMVSVVAFLYLFTFLVWSQLSVEDIKSQIDTENEWNVPWYLYPMKFGLTGLLGLAFLLSYFYKKFDKELFVFAIVAIIALLSGPYYDEHRFGKYIMVGMASLAALLIYKIMSRSYHLSFITLRFVSWLRSPTHFESKFNVVVGGILLGLVISFSGLSIFMFAGFVEQITGVADFNEGTRRDFPTNSEMQLLDFLHTRTEQSPEPNIALPYREVDNNRGFLTKIYGFTPVPRTMLLQTPLVLNASTIETFINLLDYGAIKFIVLPKEDLSGTISAISNIYPMHNVVHFALENFRKVFENDNFMVLEVPTLSPPSREGDVALVYPKNESRKKEETYYQHYYPLSMLALSKIEYSTHMEGDLSAFSKKYVIVTYDPFYNDSSLSLPMESDRTGDNSIYLDYVRNGGNLIVIDSADYGKDKSLGIFSRLLSISLTGNYARFDSLLDAASLQSTINVTSKESTTYPYDQGHEVQEKKRNHTIIKNITGMVERTLYNSSNTKDNNISITSYYITANNNTDKKNENVIVAPFTIEKKYGNGKITYINAHGYFHALFNDLSSNNGRNNDTYQGNNNGQHFLSLANITNLIDPNIPKDGQFSDAAFLNSAASPAESSGAPKIRQIIDNIRISPGYQTRINSSSLLLPVTNNSNGDLAAQELTFTSQSRIAPFSATNPSNDIAYDLSYTETADQGDQNSNYEYSFKNAIIRNLKMYGSYEVIVESNNSGKVILPVFPSFSDYVGVNLPEGFDMTIKLSDSKSSYAEFEIIEENDDGALVANGTDQRLRIYGDNATARGLGIANVKSNEIHFLDMRSDPSSNGHTSLLMKIPQIQVKEEGAATASIERDDAKDGLLENVKTFLTFNKDSSETDPIEIKNKAGKKEMVTFRIDYIDSYNAPHPEGTKNHYLTYIEEDIKVVEDNVDNDPSEKYRINMQDIKLPGDISDRAKKLGVDVEWQKTMASGNGLLLAILVTATSIIARIIGTKMSSPKLKST